MKTVLRIAAALLVVVLAGVVAIRRAPVAGVESGAPAAEFTLPSLDGRQVSLSSLRGRVVVLNFWATWCPPCVEEMPSLQRLHEVLGEEGLTVVGVSVDDDGQALADFVDRYRIRFTILRDVGERVSDAYDVRGYPTTIVIDREGEIVDRVFGIADWATPEAIQHFRERLAD